MTSGRPDQFAGQAGVLTEPVSVNAKKYVTLHLENIAFSKIITEKRYVLIEKRYEASQFQCIGGEQNFPQPPLTRPKCLY